MTICGRRVTKPFTVGMFTRASVDGEYFGIQLICTECWEAWLKENGVCDYVLGQPPRAASCGDWVDYESQTQRMTLTTAPG